MLPDDFHPFDDLSISNYCDSKIELYKPQNVYDYYTQIKITVLSYSIFSSMHACCAESCSAAFLVVHS